MYLLWSEDRRHRLILPILVLILTLPLLGCGRRVFKKTEFLMDTIAEVSVVERDKRRAQEALDLAFQEIKRLENILSIYKEGSEASLINRFASYKEVKVSSEMREVLERAIEYSQLTKGAFDITIRPLGELWGFGGGSYRVPSSQELKSKLDLINYRYLVIDPKKNTVGIKKQGVQIDLGGVAKRYILEKTAQLLRENGFRDFLVNIGGDLAVLGKRPDGKPWRVGIQHPRKSAEVMAILELSDKMVLTSGDYERYFLTNGVRYHHILDPKTGYPARGSISTTLIIDWGISQDLPSVGVFVLGPEKGLKLLERMRGLEAIIVDGQGKVYLSERLKGLRVNY